MKFRPLLMVKYLIGFFTY